MICGEINSVSFLTSWQLKILSLVKGAGSKLLCVSGVRSLLNDLLESRCSYYLGGVKSCNKLPQSEVDILCLLLEVTFMVVILPLDVGPQTSWYITFLNLCVPQCCTMANSSHEAQDLGDCILKALWVSFLNSFLKIYFLFFRSIWDLISSCILRLMIPKTWQ